MDSLLTPSDIIIMSIRHRPSRVLALGAASCLLLAGCATSFSRSEGNRVALGGQEAADGALAFYEDIRAVASDNAYYQGYLRIVASPEPDKVDFTRVSDATVAGEVDQRIKTCREVRAAYSLFQQLSADDAGKQTEQSYAALAETLKALSGDDTSFAETKQMAAALPNDRVVSRWQSRRIRQMQSVLAKLSGELAALWNKETPVWENYIDDVYLRHYASGLLSLRQANFDEKELAKAVAEPYGIPVKAGLFKLQKYREAQQKADHLKRELQQVSKAFDRLAQLHRQAGVAAATAADAVLQHTSNSPDTHPHERTTP